MPASGTRRCPYCRMFFLPAEFEQHKADCVHNPANKPKEK